MKSLLYQGMSQEQLQKHVCGYFENQKLKEKPLTVASLCVYLVVSTKTFNEYLSGEFDSKSNSYSSVLKFAKNCIKYDLFIALLSKRYNREIILLQLEKVHGINDLPKFD